VLWLAHAALLEHVPGAVYPRGWRTGPPDFVGIGAQRCGTTWWYSLLCAHPGVYHPPATPKERHWFDRRPARVERYARLFPRPEGAIAGEWTPRYMFDPWAPALLRRAAPEAKLLVLLRDPIERLASSRAPTFGDDAQAVARGLYHAQLERVLEHFPQEQLLVQQYERCVADPAAELARTYAFLGLDASFVPAGLTARVNASRSPKPELPAERLAELRRTFLPDAERLAAAFPELDLSLWRTLNG
jgi:hypothetical protein